MLVFVWTVFQSCCLNTRGVALHPRWVCLALEKTVRLSSKDGCARITPGSWVGFLWLFTIRVPYVARCFLLLFTIRVPSVARCFLWLFTIRVPSVAGCFLWLFTVSVPSVVRCLFQSLPIIYGFVCSRVLGIIWVQILYQICILKNINVWLCWVFVVWAFV